MLGRGADLWVGSSVGSDIKTWLGAGSSVRNSGQQLAESLRAETAFDAQDTRALIQAGSVRPKGTTSRETTIACKN